MRSHFHSLTTKWKLLFLGLLAAFTLISISICWPSQMSSHIVHRSRTLLIYNNEHLCSSNATLTNRHNHNRNRPLASSADETTPTTSIVIVVLSRRYNFEQRNLIRQTYGSISYINNVHILAVAFMLGGVDAQYASKADQDKLNDERVRFEDVIIGDLVDTYRNLSRKSIMAYDWLTLYCREADLVVKTDDDVFVDIFKLTADLGKWPPTAFESLKFWCAVHPIEAIDRNPKSIYYVSRAEYARKKFPKHCAGVGYVAPMRLVRRIAEEISKSFRGPVCSHEDVFLTGIVPEKINSKKDETPIEFVNKMSDWIFYIDKDNPNSDGQYVWNAIDRQ